LERVNPQKVDEALRAKEKVETQRIACTKEPQKMEAYLWSKSQSVSPINSQIPLSILKKQISSKVPNKDRGDEQRLLGAEIARPGEQPEGGSKGISPTSNGRNKIGRLHKFVFKTSGSHMLGSKRDNKDPQLSPSIEKFDDDVRSPKRSESPGTWVIPSIDESDERLNLLAKSLVAKLRSIHNNDAIGTDDDANSNNPDASGSNNAANTNYDIASSSSNAASDYDNGKCSSTEYSSSYTSSFDCTIEVDEDEPETTATRESPSTIDSNSTGISFSACEYPLIAKFLGYDRVDWTQTEERESRKADAESSHFV
jgi:hypothetical protein